MKKELIYYGSEFSRWHGDEKDPLNRFPEYTKGLYSYTLKDGEDEQTVRKTIEDRCRANPDCNFATHIISGGIDAGHFRWVCTKIDGKLIYET